MKLVHLSGKETTELHHDYTSLKFVCQKWNNFPADVSIDYIEHSPAHGYSDTETSVTLTKEDVQAIIEFLNYAFELES